MMTKHTCECCVLRRFRFLFSSFWLREKKNRKAAKIAALQSAPVCKGACSFSRRRSLTETRSARPWSRPEGDDLRTSFDSSASGKRPGQREPDIGVAVRRQVL